MRGMERISSILTIELLYIYSGTTIDPPADIGGVVFPPTFVNSHQASVFQSRLTCVAFAYTNAKGTNVIEKKHD